MKNIALIVLVSFSFLGFGQSMNITWEDSEGREFSINSHSHEFTYSIVAGDKVKYITKEFFGPVGAVAKIGDLKIKYITKSHFGPLGAVSQIGDVKIKYITKVYFGPLNAISQAGGLKIEYITNDHYGPVGSIKETTGTVLSGRVLPLLNR